MFPFHTAHSPTRTKIIRRQASGTVRVHLQVASVHQTFLSLVVTPDATVKDVLSAVRGRLGLKNDPEEFVLVETREGKGCLFNTWMQLAKYLFVRIAWITTHTHTHKQMLKLH